MNWYLVTASALAFLVGLIHSILGEGLIFRRLRQGGFVPTNGGNILDERHIRILWASWHIVTIFGWCIAYVLLRLALPTTNTGLIEIIEQAFFIAILTSAALVFISTKARHPGWVGLLGVAICIWLGR